MAEQVEPVDVPEGLNWNLWLGPAPKRAFRPALHPLNWRHNYDYSGGMVTDFGAHHIDIVQWAMDTENTGPVELLAATGELPPPDALYNTATVFHFECKYQSGFRLIVADDSQLETGIRFEGEDGKWLFVTRGKLTSHPETMAEEEIPQGQVRLYESTNHIGNFVDCIQSGKPTVAPIEAAHRTITIAHLGNIMLRLGRQKLRWDPEAEQILDDQAASKMLSRPMRSPWSLG
jgi:predicted dehydrogenase